MGISCGSQTRAVERWMRDQTCAVRTVANCHRAPNAQWWMSECKSLKLEVIMQRSGKQVGSSNADGKCTRSRSAKVLFTLYVLLMSACSGVCLL